MPTSLCSVSTRSNRSSSRDPRPCRSTSAPCAGPSAGRVGAVIGSTIWQSSAMGYAKRVEIRWRDLDGFGHVNNAVFLTYLEEARDEFYTGLLSHDTVNQMVLRHTSVDFRRSLVQSDDLVDVELVVIRVGSSSVVTSETITNKI